MSINNIQITIHNLRNNKVQFEYQVRVDRTSVLGNPFYMKSEDFRDSVCDKYERYFYSMLARAKNPSWSDAKAQAFVQELRRLYKIAKTHGKLELFCWCAPRRCHAETIKRFLEEYLLPKEPEVYQKPCSQDHFDEPLTGSEMGLTNSETLKRN